jgi:hypothetical protein
MTPDDFADRRVAVVSEVACPTCREAWTMFDERTRSFHEENAQARQPTFYLHQLRNKTPSALELFEEAVQRLHKSGRKKQGVAHGSE